MGRPKKLTLDFFMHDAIARTDRKIRLLRKYHHNDGYATYFCLLEMVCQEEGMKLQLGDPMNDEFIADECDLRDVQQLYAIIETCCRLELIDRQLWQSERIVFSHGLYKRYVARLEQRRKDAIRKNSKADKAIAASLETHIREVEGSMPKPSEEFSARKTDESDWNTCGKPRDTESEVKTRDQRPEEKSKSNLTHNPDQDLRVCDFEPSLPEPEPTKESVPVAVPVQSSRKEIQFTPDPMGDRFSAGSSQPEWRTGPGVNGLRQEFVEWLCKTYLAKLPCNKEQAAPSMADARHWIMSREKYQAELVENQWLAFSDRGAQTVAKTSAAYDWSRDSRLSEWTALADSMNNYRFCYPDGVRDEERVAFYQWLEKHQEARSA